MMEGAFYQQKRASPTALAIVVLMHGAALTALALSKMENPGRTIFGTTKVDLIPVKPDPPEVPPEPLKQKVQPQQQTVLTPPKPVFQLPAPGPTVTWTPPPAPTWTIPQPGPITEPVPEPAPAPKAKKVEPARAKANLASYVSDEDYPSTAARNEEQGTTRFRLAVAPSGRVAECTVTASSGSSALDSATCRLMKQRARFTPARDSDGRPTSDSVTSGIRWVLPE
jgi:periplasmic protein TonB